MAKGILATSWEKAWVKVLTAVFVAGIIYTVLFVRPLVSGAADSARTWLTGAHTVSGWLLLVLGIAALVVVSILVVGLLAWHSARKESPAPLWRDYVSDVWFGCQWEWEYERDGSVRSKVLARCLKCKHQLIPEGQFYGGGWSTLLKCPECGTALGMDCSPEAVPGRIAMKVDQTLQLRQNPAPQKRG